MRTQLPAELPDMLPETLNFVRQVELNRTIEGVYPISKFTRLSDLLLSNEGDVTVKLEFTHSVGIASLRGAVSAKLLVECQRCLKLPDDKRNVLEGIDRLAHGSSESKAAA